MFSYCVKHKTNRMTECDKNKIIITELVAIFDYFIINYKKRHSFSMDFFTFTNH